jgi:uncharacterized protein
MSEQKEYILRYTDNLKADENRTISGTAIVFDVVSNVINDMNVPYVEVIHKGAVTEDTIINSDIVLSFNHLDMEHVPLARSKNGKGTLKTLITENTVDFSCKAKNTSYSTEVYEGVKAGDLTGCSFKYTVGPKDHKFTRQSDGSYIHDVYKIQQLFDFSIVQCPAYNETSVFARQLQDQVNQDEENLRIEKEKLDEQVRKDIEEQNKIIELQRSKEIEFQKYYERIKKMYLS